MAKAKAMKVTVQINGNKHPDYIKTYGFMKSWSKATTSSSGWSLESTRNVDVNIWYRDEGTGYFEAELFGQVLRCPLEDSRRWKNFSQEMLVPGNDPEIRIRAGEGPLTLHMVEVLRGIPETADTSLLLSVQTDGTPGAYVEPWGRFLVNKDSVITLSVKAIPEGYRFSQDREYTWFDSPLGRASPMCADLLFILAARRRITGRKTYKC